MALRKYIISVFEQLFQQCGFQPLETPAIERLEVLLAKYGEEANKLLFRVLKNGDFTKEVPEETWQSRDWNRLSDLICDKGLRYDLTVPLARFVASNIHNLTFPFRRYQIQTVWKAKKPQKGRFREFMQCDFDIIGVSSPDIDAEVLWILEEGFRRLNLGDKISIRVNDRKLVEKVISYAGCGHLFTEICTILDKLDKVGYERVIEELHDMGLSSEQLEIIKFYLSARSTKDIIQNNLCDKDTIETIDQIIDIAQNIYGVRTICWDPALVRGLEYYTGMICEVKLNIKGATSSVAGGGRYDNLTATFGAEGIGGVGASFGVDRIVEYLMSMGDENPLDHVAESYNPHVIVIPLDEHSLKTIIPVINTWRRDYKELRIELLPSGIKLKKALKIANKKKANFTVIVGEVEYKAGLWILKDMHTGQQHKVDPNTIPDIILSRQL